MQNTQSSRQTERTAAFAFGVSFVLILILLALLIPTPTLFQYTVFRVVLALAAAGVAVFIPGIINVEMAGWLRAGGAFAVFAIVYFFSPAALVTKPQGFGAPTNIQQIGTINQSTDSGSNTAGVQNNEGTGQGGDSKPKKTPDQQKAK